MECQTVSLQQDFSQSIGMYGRSTRLSGQWLQRRSRTACSPGQEEQDDMLYHYAHNTPRRSCVQIQLLKDVVVNSATLMLPPLHVLTHMI